MHTIYLIIIIILKIIGDLEILLRVIKWYWLKIRQEQTQAPTVHGTVHTRV